VGLRRPPLDCHARVLFATCCVALAWPQLARAALPPVEAAAASAGGGNGVEAAIEPGAESGWRMPPLVWGGSLRYDLFYLTADAVEDDILRHGLTAKVNARTFIWQPWFAHLSGELGLTAAGGDGAGNSDTLTGELRLDVLPQSRFPFMASYFRGNSRFSGDPVAAIGDYTSERISVTQSYQPLQSNTRYNASFYRNSQDSEYFGETVQDTLQLGASMRIGDDQDLQLSASGIRNSHESTGEKAMDYTLLASHRYTPDPTLSVDSQASLNQYDYRLAQGRYDNRYTQLNSYAFWRPETMPLTATGSVRLFNMDSGGTRASNLNVSAGANYDLSQHARLFASASVNLSESGSDQDVYTSQTLGASYNPDPLSLGGFRYSWFSSGSASNTTGGESGVRQANLQLGHNLDRSLSFLGGSLGLGLNQSVSATETSDIDGTQQLMHGGSLGWSLSRGGGSAYLRLSATDSRELGGADERTFQLVNFQVSMSQVTGRYSTWNGNVTVQGTRQSRADAAGVAGAELGDFDVSTSAGVAYRNQRMFGVSRLSFESDLRINDNNYKTVLGGPEDTVDKSWRNQFEYAIGRTRFKLIETWSEMAGRDSLMLLFTLERFFRN
jgi:hypothetical protein